MDSSNSGSFQSSSGGAAVGAADTEEYDSRTQSNISSFLNPTNSNFNNLNHLLQPPPPLHSDSTTFFNPNPFHDPGSLWTGPLQPANRSNLTNFNTTTYSNINNPNNNNNNNTNMGHGSDLNNHNNTRNHQMGVNIKNPKKRTRASRRAPTTVLTTDTTNFRQMVQEFTGIPAAPFTSGGPFSRRLDLFRPSPQKLHHFSSSSSSLCGTCEENFTVSVSFDSFDRSVMNDDDEAFDEYLSNVLGKGSREYSVVVVDHGDWGTKVRSVVGKYRHGWIVGRFEEMDVVAEMVAEMFVKVFVSGGKDEEGSVDGEFMLVGADGRIVLSFNLLNADPRDWIYEWDFKEVDEKLLAPILESLSPIANISVESQVLYHAPKSSYSYWDAEQESHIFSTKDLPFFVNSNEWHLDTSIAAGGRSKIFQFVVYIPSANECPLRLQLPNGELSVTNGFISPTWGGVVVLNPSKCLENGNDVQPLRRKVSPQELNQIFEVFMGQLRQLFGLKSSGFYKGASGTTILLGSERGFTDWELDALARQHACYNLRQCGTTLGSLSRLVQSLPRMIIKDEIGKQVKFSLEAAKLAQKNASQGIYDASAVSSRHARSLAEDAFFHPSVMSVSYYSFEHMFAVYSPFFLPLSLHVILAVVREIKRYKQESQKYAAWKAVARQHSD